MKEEKKNVCLILNEIDGKYDFDCLIQDSIEIAESTADKIDELFQETQSSIKNLSPECDKIDYALAASSGVISGIVDIFLVGSPEDTSLGKYTDKFYEKITQRFAKLSGWESGKDSSLNSAIRFLEQKFKVPYDQTHSNDVFELNTFNHHFKSLGHNPSLLGLFFSILNQFTLSSTMVSGGEVLTLSSDSDFELKGNSLPGKLFCGFCNWLGHLISDQSGSSSSDGRGMGIPSPLWTWINDVIVVKRNLHIPVTEFEKDVGELAVEVYKKGYDSRFQTTQMIPVIINELLVRFIYSVRRMFRYFSTTDKDERSFSLFWKTCEPFSNSTVKRMLTVAHGTFFLIDSGDAVIRGFATGGGYFNVAEFVMRFNIPGAGRFVISLYGEAGRKIEIVQLNEDSSVIERERKILNDYLNGLEKLAEIYNDDELLRFTDDFRSSNAYKQGFEKTIALAEKRGVPEERMLKNKTEIDDYFGRDK